MTEQNPVVAATDAVYLDNPSQRCTRTSTT